MPRSENAIFLFQTNFWSNLKKLLSETDNICSYWTKSWAKIGKICPNRTKNWSEIGKLQFPITGLGIFHEQGKIVLLFIPFGFYQTQISWKILSIINTIVIFQFLNLFADNKFHTCQRFILSCHVREFQAKCFLPRWLGVIKLC